jgi:hypothetical protein
LTAIRYSDERLCEIVASQPDTETLLYRVFSRRPELGASLTEAVPEAPL